MTEPVTLGDKFDRALALASNLHRDQKRKGSEVPYISHLMAVAALVLEDDGDEEEAIAGLLHDALEDCAEQISGEDLEEKFGPRVRELVEACTDTPLDFGGGQEARLESSEGRIHRANRERGNVPPRIARG